MFLVQPRSKACNYAGLSCHWPRRFFSFFLFFFFFRLVVRTDWSLGRQGRNAFNGTGVFGGASGGCAVVGNGGNNTSTRPNLPVRSAGHTCSSPQLICRQISRFGGSRPGPPDKCGVVASCLRARDGRRCLLDSGSLCGQNNVDTQRNRTKNKIKLGNGEWIFYTRGRGYRCAACHQLLNLSAEFTACKNNRRQEATNNCRSGRPSFDYFFLFSFPSSRSIHTRNFTSDGYKNLYISLFCWWVG